MKESVMICGAPRRSRHCCGVRQPPRCAAAASACRRYAVAAAAAAALKIKSFFCLPISKRGEGNERENARQWHGQANEDGTDVAHFAACVDSGDTRSPPAARLGSMSDGTERILERTRWYWQDVPTAAHCRYAAGGLWIEARRSL